MPGNFPPEGLPRGVLPSQPVHHMAGYRPEIGNVNNFHVHPRQPNYGEFGLMMPGATLRTLIFYFVFTSRCYSSQFASSDMPYCLTCYQWEFCLIVSYIWSDIPDLRTYNLGVHIDSFSHTSSWILLVSMSRILFCFFFWRLIFLFGLLWCFSIRSN